MMLPLRFALKGKASKLNRLAQKVDGVAFPQSSTSTSTSTIPSLDPGIVATIHVQSLQGSRYGKHRSHPFMPRSLSTSSSPSIEATRRPAFQVKFAVSELPHPEKDHGDDANFSYQQKNGYTWLGVFDGVGGWSDQGVDPAEYARALSHECRAIVENPPKNKIFNKNYETELMTRVLGAATASQQTKTELPHNVPSPLEVLRHAYDAVEERGILGSTTACICVVTPKCLFYSNVGDSGLKLIRNGKITFKTTEKQHAFNTPYQLGGQGSDQPEDGDVGEYPIQHGDIIVLGTDGLFDNLFDDDIENIIAGRPISSASTPFRSRPRSPSPTRSSQSSPSPSPSTSTSSSFSSSSSSSSSSPSSSSPPTINVLPDLNDIAHRISEEAQKRARLPDYESPFQVNASKYHKHFRGGKMDDITVVIAQILLKSEHFIMNTGSAFLSGETPTTTNTASATAKTSEESDQSHESSESSSSSSQTSPRQSKPPRRRSPSHRQDVMRM